jgi:hypothetical protein
MNDSIDIVESFLPIRVAVNVSDSNGNNRRGKLIRGTTTTSSSRNLPVLFIKVGNEMPSDETGRSCN